MGSRSESGPARRIIGRLRKVLPGRILPGATRRPPSASAAERRAPTSERAPQARAELRAVRRRLAATRRQARAVRAELRATRKERGALQRELRAWREAATWLDPEDQAARSGGPAGQPLRARLTAASLVEALSRGEDPARALVAYAQGLAEVQQHPFRYRLPGLAMALSVIPEFRAGAHAALVVHGLSSGHPELARHHLALCGDEEAAALIPVELARVRLADDPRAAPAVLAAIRAHAVPSSTQWLDVLSAIAATEDLVTLAAATDALTETAASWPVEDTRVFARFVEYADRSRTTPVARAADLTLGVMGYRRADLRTGSKNVGDWVQTISMLSHLLRHTGVRLEGEPDVVDAVTELRSRMRPDLLIDGPERTVALVEVSRDDSRLDQVPEDTWYLAFGWHTHPDILGGHGLPYHPHLRPIFVSFHCHRRDMLSPAAVDYLRRYAPIGCRDWYTLDMLTHLGVPAFFTGCVTTTVDAYFSGEVDRTGLPTGYVDARPPDGSEPIRQVHPEVAHRSLADNLRDALGLLDHYRADFGSLVTGRLHCYLPATSIGVPTTFRPKRRFDLRFEGLTDEDADLDAIRHRLRHDLLEPMVTAILAGDTQEEVYDRWRSLTEPLVAADVARRRAAYAWPTTSLDIDGTRSRILDAAWRRPGLGTAAGGLIDLCVVLDRGYRTQLHAVIDGVLQHTTRPLRLWALVRGLEVDDFEAFAKAFPEVDVTFLPCDGVDYGDVTVKASRITVSTMDRLLLPELLPELDKVLYLDLDLLPRADIGDLFDTPLGDAGVAARPNPSASSMGGLVGYADLTMKVFQQSREGWRLVNLAHLRTGSGDTGFNAGVMVLGLARMRADDFVRRYVGFAEEFGLNDQYVMNLYASGSFVELDRRWNAWPGWEVLDSPWLVHWVGALKPWGPVLVEFQDEWQAAVAAAEERRGVH